MFAGYLPHTATISRLSQGAGQNTRTYGVKSSGVPCFLQPLEASQSILYGLAVGQGYRCYFDMSADIKTQDKLVIDGQEFRVNGLNIYNYGFHPHKRATIVAED